MTTLAELIPALIQKTREEKISWNQLAANSFFAELNAVGIEVARVGLETVVRLRNKNGSIIESINAMPGIQQANDPIFTLYEVARRKGLKIDESIDLLKNALDKL